jgi:hypothetical protein
VCSQKKLRYLKYPDLSLFEFVVDLLPAWTPGTIYRNKAKQIRECSFQAATIPYQYAKERYVSYFFFVAWYPKLPIMKAAGIDQDSFVGANLQNASQPLTIEEDHMLNMVAGVMYGGGSDTVRYRHNLSSSRLIYSL